MIQPSMRRLKLWGKMAAVLQKKKKRKAKMKSEMQDHTSIGTETCEAVEKMADVLQKKKKRKATMMSQMQDHIYVGTETCEALEKMAAVLQKKQKRKATTKSEMQDHTSVGTETCEAMEKMAAKRKAKIKSETQDHTSISTETCEAIDVGLAKLDKDTVHVDRVTQTKVVTVNDKILAGSQKFVVHVSRQEEVEIARRKLPIFMMEQEIMEAIVENPVAVICGETGCGKTTQVPQFLYEAGFSSRDCAARSGIIGVTQPRRVAVLATAKRVSHEMDLRLGKDVGFQVRHDRKLGENTRIKFMTDGILLREIQADFLLRKYSVIVLDEAHERNLNTDILIGMLSRILPLRQSLFEEQHKSVKSGNGPSVFPLKLVIMSATLRVDDFVSNRDLFAQTLPVVQVPTRQFPVTVHFSAKTELLDYVGRAYKKVCSIHKNLPPGGVLVFLTGQAEVHDLCRRLRKAFPKFDVKKEHDIEPSLVSLNNSNVTESMENGSTRDCKGAIETYLEDISKAVDGDYSYDDSDHELEMQDDWEMSDTMVESSSESDCEILSMTVTEHKEAENGGSLQSPASLEAIRVAFDAFSGAEKDEHKQFIPKPGQHTDRSGLSKVAGPLHVLPLYAMLPAAAQLKVFDAIPDGSRLVVVATNVAETSITIPGVKYVVDCGRVKEKVYERASGVTRYEVRWISKASAAQRAGRAGRTGPGHCYRLYSSAVFNDTFQAFSEPEIHHSPIEGVVLLLKGMGITKVSNFPFPSRPDQIALAEAECCLKALSALDSTSGLLTPLGHAISAYPIGPRHSRMLLTAMHVGSTNNALEANLLLAYAAATASALSLDSPFIWEVESQNEIGTTHGSNAGITPDADSKPLGKSKQHKSDTKHLAQARHRHPLSDALSVVAALRAYETSNDPEEFCQINYLHATIMHEMSKLRKQLIQLYLLSCNNEFHRNSTACLTVNMNDVEAVWRCPRDQGLSTKHEQVLRQAICAGWADRVAHKVSLQEMIKNKDIGEPKKRKRIQYQAAMLDELVFLHPSSSVRKIAPEFVVYNELVCSSRPYMRVVTSVDAHWLVLHANPLCTFSKPLSDPPPWYDASSDDVFCWVSPSFGPYFWDLPLCKLHLKSSQHRIAVFACALIAGKVLPSLAILFPHLAADPFLLLTPTGRAHKRVSELLHALGAAEVDSRHKLNAVWNIQPEFLFQEIQLWVQKGWLSELGSLWAQLKQEAQLDGKELFEKKKRKLHLKQEHGRS